MPRMNEPLSEPLNFSILRRSLAVAGAAGLCFLGGCKADPSDVSFEGITSNLTPELHSIAERPSDADRNLAVTWNQNIRSFWSDFGRFWMLDNPSPLTPYPTISTSGIP